MFMVLGCDLQVSFEAVRRGSMSLPSGISQLLRQRGHKIVSEGSDDDIFLPATEDGEILDAFKVLLYRLMRNDEVRKVLRDWAYGKTADEVPDVAIIESYMTLCSRFGAVRRPSGLAMRVHSNGMSANSLSE